MPAQPALFPQPRPDTPGLSSALAGPPWRLARGEVAKWTRLGATSRMDCLECIYLQHEQAGAYGPRRKAKRRRSIAAGRLDLCHAHAEAWRHRDREDSAAPKGAA